MIELNNFLLHWNFEASETSGIHTCTYVHECKFSTVHVDDLHDLSGLTVNHDMQWIHCY